MLLKFYIDNEIHRLTHHDINKNITNQVCKCIFNFNEDIWKNEDIYITFIDNNNNGVSMHIGEWQKKICCVALQLVTLLDVCSNQFFNHVTISIFFCATLSPE